MLFEKNRDFLTKRFPYLSSELTGPSDEIGIEVERGKTGLPVARVNWTGRRIYLNSPYDPELDARRWAVNQFRETTAHNVLVCGAGFLYHIKAISELEKFDKIIVYEPSPTIFRACLQKVDLEPVYGSNILLVVGTDFENIYKQISIFLGKDFFYHNTELGISVLPAYQELFQDQIAKLQNEFIETLRVERFNLATTNQYIENWLLNEFKNLRTLSDTPALRHFLGQFKDIPAIIVAAGPSLEKNVNLLNDVKERALIISAGSSIRAMKRNGVSPHFQLAVDPHEINAKLYNEVDLTDVYFLYCFNFFYGVIEKLRGAKILFQTNAEIFPAFITQKLQYEVGCLSSGFSCSHTCLDLAYLLGCNPIILIGQDLAYTDKKRYAEGHLASHQKYLQDNELPPGCFITKDIYGQDIVTDKHLDGFRIIFETMIDHMYREKVQIINATEGGLPIRGVTNRKLVDVLADYCREDRGISDLIRRNYERGLQELQNRRINPAPLMQKLKALIERGVVKMEELAGRIQQLRMLNFSGESEISLLEQILDKLCQDYDQTLNLQEYHILLKQLQVTKLSINKYRTAQTTDHQTKEEYDERLQSYLLIILETQKCLEYIRKCIIESFPTSPAVENKPCKFTIETEEFRRLLQQIRKNENPNKIGRLLEQKLGNVLSASDRSLYLYLAGLNQARGKQFEKAIALLEEAVTLNDTFEPTLILLGKLYYRQFRYTLATKYLVKCREKNYKPNYCLRMLVKINYLGKDYVAVNNLLEEYKSVPTFQRLYGFLKAECLGRLGLIAEASKEFEKIRGEKRLPVALSSRIKKLLDSFIENEYMQRYRMNLEVFKRRDLRFADYSQVRYKVCRFLGGELIYDSVAGKFFPGQSQTVPNDLRIWLDDALVIHDIDNIGVFTRLQQIDTSIESAEIQSQFRNIPIYVIGHNLDRWQLMMQLFSFDFFDDWRNTHFYIGITVEELRRAFLDDTLRLPTILHGTNYERFERFMQNVKHEKDEIYLKNLQELKEYYQSRTDVGFGKILLVYNFQNEISRFYADIIKDFLAQKGVECRIYFDDSAYRFTPYSNARVLNEYRPDLVIGLSLVQEEMDALNEIPVPFISWLMADKSLAGVSSFINPEQRLLITGNLEVTKEIEAKGYPASRIQVVPIPVVPIENESFTVIDIYDIGINTDLINIEEILKNLEVVICGVLSTSFGSMSRGSIASILNMIYFKIHAESLNKGLNQLENDLYQRIIQEKFSNRGLSLNQETIQFIAALLKRELENSLLKMMQTKWVIDNFKDRQIVFYGTGWEKIEYYKPYHKKTAGFFSDPVKYQQLVLQNKINLYPGNLLRNNSYLQPDLLYGIVAGGFFLVNDLLVKEYGDKVLEPFEGLLITYGAKEELVEKVEYFLNHEHERLNHAKQLQDYVRENFGMDQVLKWI